MMCKYFGCSIIIVVENVIDVSVVTEINYQLGTLYIFMFTAIYNKPSRPIILPTES